MGTLSVDKLMKTSTGAAEFTLPATDGAAGTVLQTDGSGQLSVATVGSSGIATNAVGSSQIAANAVTASEIAASTITPAQMANSAFLANRNIVQNGAMQIAQRATTATGETGSNAYTTCDRWRFSLFNDATYTSSQETLTAGNAFADGFRKAFRVDCTTANASPIAGSGFVIQQRIEGYNAQGLKKGTANAESTTISFWVKSNLTGNYSFGLFDKDNDRNIWQLYTISAADTWEKKTITFAGDTTGGTLNNDNNAGLEMWWYLGAGTDYTSGTLQTSWGANVWANNAAGQTVSMASSTANDWAITGVQLEIGTTATPFEHKSFGEELAICKRYYDKETTTTPFQGFVESGDDYGGNIWFTTTMRATPTITSTHVTSHKFPGTNPPTSEIMKRKFFSYKTADGSSSGSTSGYYRMSWTADSDL